jgi:hypothetical protein
MNVQHINIKFFVQNPASVRLDEYQSIFNTWIQRHLTEELLVDVAEYLHVHDGPGIVLIGHEANYSLDNTAGRLGLLYNRKAPLEGSTQDKLVQAARAALIAARVLEKENGLKFDGQQAQIIVNDRLLVPNTIETFGVLEPDLKSFFGALYNDTGFELSHTPDPRTRFQVDVKAAAPFDVDSLLQNLGVEPVHA